MSRVFGVQRPTYYDRAKKGWVNKYDLGPAKEFGSLSFMLPPGNIFQKRLDEAIELMEKALADFTKDDYLLMLGDPVAIAIAAMITSRNTGGEVRALKFDRHSGKYVEYNINLTKTMADGT